MELLEKEIELKKMDKEIELIKVRHAEKAAEEPRKRGDPGAQKAGDP